MKIFRTYEIIKYTFVALDTCTSSYDISSWAPLSLPTSTDVPPQLPLLPQLQSRWEHDQMS